MANDSDPREPEVDRLSSVLQVRLSVPQRRGAELLADQRGSTTSAVVRGALIEHLEKFVDPNGLNLHERLRRDVESEAQAHAELTYSLARPGNQLPVRRIDEP